MTNINNANDILDLIKTGYPDQHIALSISDLIKIKINHKGFADDFAANNGLTKKQLTDAINK